MTPTEPIKTELITQPSVQPAPRVPLNEMLALVRDTELVATYGREIIESQLAINRFDQDWRLARVFAESGLFADAQQLNQAMTKIQLGRSWNMDAADAMRFIYFVKGKPSVENEYMAAKMRDSGLNWEIEWHRNDSGLCIGCTLYPSRLQPDGSWRPIMDRKGADSVPASVSFTKTDADRIKTKEDGKYIPLSEKETYKSFPDDMYYWRSISRLRKRYATNVLSGSMMREEAEELAAIQPEPAPVKVAQIATAADFIPGRQARKRAGSEDIEGTIIPPFTSRKDIPDTAQSTSFIDTLKVHSVEPVTEANPLQPEASTATAPSAPKLPWTNKADMENVFRVQKFRVGDRVFSDTLAANNLVIGDLKPEGGVSVGFYHKLKALPDETVTTQPVRWPDGPAMFADFRVQRERLGVKKFEELLNSKEGFSFGQSSFSDPQAVEMYDAMVATVVPTTDKPKKLF